MEQAQGKKSADGTQNTKGSASDAQDVRQKKRIDGTQNTKQVQYTRAQKGHSIILGIIFGGFLLWIPQIYWAISPNHYYHL